MIDFIKPNHSNYTYIHIYIIDIYLYNLYRYTYYLASVHTEKVKHGEEQHLSEFIHIVPFIQGGGSSWSLVSISGITLSEPF